MNVFDSAPEFLERDNRQRRVMNPVTKEILVHKHEVLFPPELIKGKSILDLGCALGATGHWCLSNGAASYHGIEGQKTYADEARELLERYHPGKARIDTMPIEEFLAKTTEKYDIVSILGVMYVFTDYYSILKAICSHTRETAVFDCQYPFHRYFKPGFVGVQFVDEQHINIADEDASLKGRGTRISPLGLVFIMKEFGFESKEGQLYPKPSTDGIDVYNTLNCVGPRYLMRFTPTGERSMNLSQDLLGDKKGGRFEWSGFYG